MYPSKEQSYIPDLALNDAELLLSIFGQAPVAFHRCYIDIIGSVTAAIWLSHAVYHLQDNENNHDEWFSKSAQQWREETGLSRREQENARKQLKALGLLEEQQPGLQQPMRYRIKGDRLIQLLRQHASQSLNNNINRKNFFMNEIDDVIFPSPNYSMR